MLNKAVVILLGVHFLAEKDCLEAFTGIIMDLSVL